MAISNGKIYYIQSFTHHTSGIWFLAKTKFTFAPIHRINSSMNSFRWRNEWILHLRLRSIDLHNNKTASTFSNGRIYERFFRWREWCVTLHVSKFIYHFTGISNIDRRKWIGPLYFVSTRCCAIIEFSCNQLIRLLRMSKMY